MLAKHPVIVHDHDTPRQSPRIQVVFPIPTSIDLSTRRLQVTGLVDKPMALSKVAIEKYFLATWRRGFV